jgi:putative FmdB family regulatory protein
MPFYEYECRGCGHRFEELLAYTGREEAEKKLVCPQCGKRAPRRLVSTFASALPPESASEPRHSCGSGG